MSRLTAEQIASFLDSDNDQSDNDEVFSESDTEYDPEEGNLSVALTESSESDIDDIAEVESADLLISKDGTSWSTTPLAEGNVFVSIFPTELFIYTSLLVNT